MKKKIPTLPHLLRPGDRLSYPRETVEHVSDAWRDAETTRVFRVVTCKSGRVVHKNEGELLWVQRPSQTR